MDSWKFSAEEERLNTLCCKVVNLHKNRTDNLTRLKEQKANCHVQIRLFRHDLNQYLDKIENLFLLGTSTLANEQKAAIESVCNKLKKLLHILKFSQRNLKDIKRRVINDGSSFALQEVQGVRRVISEKESFFYQTMASDKGCMEIDLNLTMHPELQLLSSKIKSMGEVFITSKPIDIKSNQKKCLPSTELMSDTEHAENVYIEVAKTSIEEQINLEPFDMTEEQINIEPTEEQINFEPTVTQIKLEPVEGQMFIRDKKKDFFRPKIDKPLGTGDIFEHKYWGVSVFNTWRQWRNDLEMSKGSKSDTDRLVPSLYSDISFENLNFWLEKFVLEVRRKDGKEYPAEALRLICNSIWEYFKCADEEMNFDPSTDERFADYQQILSESLTKLTEQNISVGMESEATLLENVFKDNQNQKQNAQNLSYAMYYYNCEKFGLKSAEDHYAVDAAQYSGHIDNQECFLQFKNFKEKQCIKVRHNMHGENAKCFVKLFVYYLSLIPEKGPFYRHPLVGQPDEQPQFSCERLKIGDLEGYTSKLCEFTGKAFKKKKNARFTLCKPDSTADKLNQRKITVLHGMQKNSFSPSIPVSRPYPIQVLYSGTDTHMATTEPFTVAMTTEPSSNVSISSTKVLNINCTQSRQEKQENSMDIEFQIKQEPQDEETEIKSQDVETKYQKVPKDIETKIKQEPQDVEMEISDESKDIEMVIKQEPKDTETVSSVKPVALFGNVTTQPVISQPVNIGGNLTIQPVIAQPVTAQSSTGFVNTLPTISQPVTMQSLVGNVTTQPMYAQPVTIQPTSGSAVNPTIIPKVVSNSTQPLASYGFAIINNVPTLLQIPQSVAATTPNMSITSIQKPIKSVSGIPVIRQVVQTVTPAQGSPQTQFLAQGSPQPIVKQPPVPQSSPNKVIFVKDLHQKPVTAIQSPSKVINFNDPNLMKQTTKMGLSTIQVGINKHAAANSPSVIIGPLQKTSKSGRPLRPIEMKLYSQTDEDAVYPVSLKRVGQSSTFRADSIPEQPIELPIPGSSREQSDPERSISDMDSDESDNDEQDPLFDELSDDGITMEIEQSKSVKPKRFEKISEENLKEIQEFDPTENESHSTIRNTKWGVKMFQDRKQTKNKDVNRFASIQKDDSEVYAMMESSEDEDISIKLQNKTAVKLFREYLAEKKLDIYFVLCNGEELDDILSKFYLEMRSKDGKMYKMSTMRTYRRALQRHLLKEYNIDIRNKEAFKKSTKTFKSMSKELRKLGLGLIEHKPTGMEDCDIEKMYEYFCQDLEDPLRLQYKVFVDIMLHFSINRNRKHLVSMKKEHFSVEYDAHGNMYVCEVDKKSLDSAERMYEIKGSIRCPVRSFVKYIRRLNPNCSNLFQHASPNPNYRSNIYYENKSVGANKIGGYMTEISKAVGLSKEYTNYSCRVLKM